MSYSQTLIDKIRELEDRLKISTRVLDKSELDEIRLNNIEFSMRVLESRVVSDKVWFMWLTKCLK